MASKEPSLDPVSLLDPMDRRTFYIGLLAQSWVLIETFIDIACEAAFLDLGGKDKVPDLPRSMSRKIQLLRHVYNDSGKLAALRGPTVRILDYAGEAAEDRNKHIHAAAMGGLSGDGSALLSQYSIGRKGLLATTSLSSI